MPGGNNVGAVTLLYSGQNQTGDALVCGSSDGTPRYERWTPHDLYVQGATYKLRSGTVFASSSGAAALILFMAETYWGSPFAGEFIQYTNAHSSAQWDFNVPNEFFFDPGGGPLSMVNAMLVLPTQRTTEFRVSFRDSVLPLWNQFASDLPSQVILKGNPLLAWTAFPKNVQFLNENNIYLLIEQEIEIDFTDYWSNYQAEIRYWLHLHNNNGVVTGHVAKWSYWIEGGAFTSVVEQILKPNLELGVAKINNALNTALGAFPPNVQALYYLPGRQLSQIGQGAWNVHWEGKHSDVTIVAEIA